LRQHHDSSWWKEAERERFSLAFAFHHDESWYCLNRMSVNVLPIMSIKPQEARRRNDNNMEEFFTTTNLELSEELFEGQYLLREKCIPGS
jgi:hypothetical protein